MRYMIDLMTAGVAMARVASKPSGWVPFRFPQRIMALSRSRAERATKKGIGAKIKRRMHLSFSSAQREVLPYLHVIFENNPPMAAGLTRWFDFDAEEVEYIAGGERKAKAILKSAK